MDNDNPVPPIVLGNFYRIETYTDQTGATIYQQVPVTAYGERDPMRQDQFGGAGHILFNGRPTPINFQMEGVYSLGEAIEKFPEACQACIDKINDQAVRSKILTSGGAVSAGKKLNGQNIPLIDLSKTRKN